MGRIGGLGAEITVHMSSSTANSAHGVRQTEIKARTVGHGARRHSGTSLQSASAVPHGVPAVPTLGGTAVRERLLLVGPGFVLRPWGGRVRRSGGTSKKIFGAKRGGLGGTHFWGVYSGVQIQSKKTPPSAGDALGPTPPPGVSAHHPSLPISNHDRPPQTTHPWGCQDSCSALLCRLRHRWVPVGKVRVPRRAGYTVALRKGHTGHGRWVGSRYMRYNNVG